MTSEKECTSHAAECVRLAGLTDDLTVRDHLLDLDPPPLKWSDLRYVFDIQEDCNGKEAIQA